MVFFHKSPDYFSLDFNILRDYWCKQLNRSQYENYCIKRRESREYAREQARKHREILAQVEAELNEQFDFPIRFRRIRDEND